MVIAAVGALQCVLFVQLAAAQHDALRTFTLAEGTAHAPTTGAANSARARPADQRTIPASEPVARADREAITAAGAAPIVRAARAAHRVADLVRWLFVALCLELATFATVWFRLIGPAEQRLRASLAEVSALRSDVQTLFDDNPDAIAVYSPAGVLMRVNRARAELLGIPAPQLIGRQALSFIEPRQRAEAQRMFDRALSGESLSYEVQMENASGEAVDVAMKLFPRIVDDAVAGVIAVSRDMRELRRAQAETDEMSRRLAALCEIASTHGSDWKAQIGDALALAAGQLGCEHGFVAEVIDDSVSLLLTFGEPDLVPGRAVPLNETLTQLIMRSDELWIVDDLAHSPWHQYALPQETGWRSIVALTLRANGALYGTLMIGSTAVRRVPLRSVDAGFLKILSVLVGSMIERGRQAAKLDGLAFSDMLTGLPNRVVATERLEQLVAAAQSRGTPFAVHFIDLDRFKEVNDEAGHDAGDEVLREVAQRFSACVRSTDTVARLGGDEFLILQTSSVTRQGAADLAARIVDTAQQPFRLAGTCYQLGCSIGIAIYPDDGVDARTLLKRADEAMYRAKAGRDGGAVFAA